MRASKIRLMSFRIFYFFILYVLILYSIALYVLYSYNIKSYTIIQYCTFILFYILYSIQDKKCGNHMYSYSKYTQYILYIGSNVQHPIWPNCFLRLKLLDEFHRQYDVGLQAPYETSFRHSTGQFVYPTINNKAKCRM